MHSFAVLKTDYLYKSRLTEAKSTKLDCMPVMCGGASDRYLFQLLIFQKNISLATIYCHLQMYTQTRSVAFPPPIQVKVLGVSTLKVLGEEEKQQRDPGDCRTPAGGRWGYFQMV